MRRAGSAEEVAATIAFLASAGGAYVTGSTVLVDGGADAWGTACGPRARAAGVSPLLARSAAVHAR